MRKRKVPRKGPKKKSTPKGNVEARVVARVRKAAERKWNAEMDAAERAKFEGVDFRNSYWAYKLEIVGALLDELVREKIVRGSERGALRENLSNGTLIEDYKIGSDKARKQGKTASFEKEPLKRLIRSTIRELEGAPNDVEHSVMLNHLIENYDMIEKSNGKMFTPGKYLIDVMFRINADRLVRLLGDRYTMVQSIRYKVMAAGKK